MRIVNTANYKSIKSNTCGMLTELLNDPNIPISITKAVDINTTTKHKHRHSTELYWVVNGKLEIELVTKGKKEVIKLEKGTILVINPGEFHSVVKASETNEVIVLSNPPWTPDDEFLI